MTATVRFGPRSEEATSLALLSARRSGRMRLRCRRCDRERLPVSISADCLNENTAESERPHSGLVLTINRVATGGCLSQDAALPREEDPEAVQAPAAAGTAHLRRVVHLLAHQPGQDHKTPLQLWKRTLLRDIEEGSVNQKAKCKLAVHFKKWETIRE
ncbi:hypothetical protein EXN66_Car004684 [Channa argus]|uniref:Uncharacterized protein n=1 Tax=Channa argus TaxID=215402 RepID=A0A6G1PFJ7_CHAAH|nr:hypothetical protein EXN66_Car004684 [Channa argus]